ncbi:hypothetical protein [Paenibacillus sp. UNC499MF]|uniref:hypothetical protein n=1 Tax=Paenibacillus sp. UNC499MF TaxID=1502751 RepID=UPI0008A026B0|nr:hypothetical protein [Paenibacillus sp. UNC499MF]SEG75076.1 hypothetical protein SAMN02799616_04775 [Paenibacillus sp. UNC499MF]
MNPNFVPVKKRIKKSGDQAVTGYVCLFSCSVEANFIETAAGRFLPRVRKSAQ